MNCSTIAKLEEGACGSQVCPLNQIKAGMLVRIRQLDTAPEMTSRLREIGFVEGQLIRLVTSQANIICQVCNARLALNNSIARMILVECVA